MARDRIELGIPRNTSKKDFILYSGGGLGGGASPTHPPNNRYSYWIDHNPFATAIRKLIAQNVSFEIYQDAAGTIGQPMYCRIEQSNDCPDEILMLASEISAGRTLYLDPASLPPPYYINTKFLSNPTDFNYQNDQGRYVYNAYNGSGFGLAKSGAGGWDAIFQSFIPQSPILTGLWLKRLFRVGSTSDHTLFSDITVNLYDASFALVGTIGKLKKTYPLQYNNNPPVVGVNYNTVFFNTADDALQYWNDIDQIQFIPDKPIAVKAGQQYYIGVMPDTLAASITYAVGNNLDTSGAYNGLGRYIYGQAYSANKTAGVFTSVTAAGASGNQSICFVTQRNVGRTAYTFVWDSTSRYWYDPATFKDQFKFVKEDFDQRI
jgi:hypothetical protein